MMCLNEILRDEQLTMMRFSRATNTRDIAACQEQFVHLQASFRSFPYPHRPFFWPTPTEEAMPAASATIRPIGRFPEPAAGQGAF